MPEPQMAAALATPLPILLASDGGAVPGRGSFGWVLQVGSTILARGKGPAFGPDPRSFRAEGYGMGSGLLYLRLLQQQFNLEWSTRRHCKLICDNAGLLIRIETTLKWSHIHPNVTLRAEWDLESLILTMYRALGIQFLFTHVKSHQDDSIPVASLPLEVRLNVEADRLATEYLATSHSQGRATLFPSAKCQLLVDGATVSRKLPNGLAHSELTLWKGTNGNRRPSTPSIGLPIRRPILTTANIRVS